MWLQSRVALSPASPLRRLLKPHYFHTTAINSASIGTLFPIDALAFRSFGFTEKSWVKYFKDAFAEWECVDSLVPSYFWQHSLPSRQPQHVC